MPRNQAQPTSVDSRRARLASRLPGALLGGRASGLPRNVSSGRPRPTPATGHRRDLLAVSPLPAGRHAASVHRLAPVGEIRCGCSCASLNGKRRNTRLAVASTDRRRWISQSRLSRHRDQARSRYLACLLALLIALLLRGRRAQSARARSDEPASSGRAALRRLSRLFHQSADERRLAGARLNAGKAATLPQALPQWCLIGDFLEPDRRPASAIVKWLSSDLMTCRRPLAAGSSIPAEETLPYTGRAQGFSGDRGRPQTAADRTDVEACARPITTRLAAQRIEERGAGSARRHGWTLTVSHRTDRLAGDRADDALSRHAFAAI